MFDIKHMMEESCSSGSCSYNGKEPTNNEACKKEACPPNNETCKKEQCPPSNEACKKEGCKRESSVFEPMFQALDEFKSDIADQHLANRLHDRMTGNHEYSKAYKSQKNTMRDGLSGRDLGIEKAHAKNMKDKEQFDKDNAYIRDAAKKADTKGGMKKNGAEYVKRSTEVANKYIESTSIFESLFSQI